MLFWLKAAGFSLTLFCIFMASSMDLWVLGIIVGVWLMGAIDGIRAADVWRG